MSYYGWRTNVASFGVFMKNTDLNHLKWVILSTPYWVSEASNATECIANVRGYNKKIFTIKMFTVYEVF